MVDYVIKTTKKYNVLALLVLCATVHITRAQNKTLKCSDFTSNICGPNAKCYDDVSTWKYSQYLGPYCECGNGFVGKPPNCKKGCGYDYNCADDEYCSKNNDCIKGCRQSSGCNFNEHCDVDGTRKCLKGCTSNKNCDIDEFCNVTSQTCQKVCDHFSCGENSVCAGILHGKHCGCVDGFVPISGRGCVKKEAAEIQEFDCQKSCGKFADCNLYKKSCYCSIGLGRNPFIECDASYPQAPITPGGDYSISLTCVVTICTG